MKDKNVKHDNFNLKRAFLRIEPYYELFELATSNNLQELFNKSIEIAKMETESFHGFIGMINENNTLSIETFNSFKDSCKVVDKTDRKRLSSIAEISYLYEYSIKTGKPYFTNEIDYTKFMKNLPEGHIKITNFLSVPIIKRKQVIGAIILANATVDYENKHVEIVSKIAHFLSLVMDTDESTEDVVKSILNLYDNDFLCVIKDYKIKYLNDYLSDFIIDNYFFDPLIIRDMREYRKFELINILLEAYENTMQNGKFSKSINLNIENFHIPFEIRAFPVISESEIVGVSIILKNLSFLEETIAKTKKDYEFEKFVSTLLQDIYNSNNLKESIIYCLKCTVEHLDISGISVYEKENKKVKKSYFWYNEKFESKDENDEEILWEIFKRIYEDGVIIANLNIADKKIEDFLKKNGLLSLVVYPLIQKGEIFGFITFEEKKIDKKWSIREAELLKIISNVIASAILQKRSEDMLIYASTHDKLTGIYNRAYFEAEVERLKNGRRFPISFFVIDLNELKYINDNFGHEAGDELIKRAADILKKSIRGEDCLARLGGDEFAIVVPGADENIVKTIYNRIVSNQKIYNENSDIKVSMAIGFSLAKNSSEIENSLKEADKRMYKHKNSLKNR